MRRSDWCGEPGAGRNDDPQELTMLAIRKYLDKKVNNIVSVIQFRRAGIHVQAPSNNGMMSTLLMITV